MKKTWPDCAATVLIELPEVDLSRDPQDNPVLAMAIAGKADYLVTGDRWGLLSLKRVGDGRGVSEDTEKEALTPPFRSNRIELPNERPHYG